MSEAHVDLEAEGAEETLQCSHLLGKLGLDILDFVSLVVLAHHVCMDPSRGIPKLAAFPNFGGAFRGAFYTGLPV